MIHIMVIAWLLYGMYITKDYYKEYNNNEKNVIVNRKNLTIVIISMIIFSPIFLVIRLLGNLFKYLIYK